MAFSLISSDFLNTLKLVSWESVYLIGTIITGLLVGYNAFTIKQNNGKTPETLMMGIGSLLEGVWLLVSGIILYYTNFLPIVNAIPAAYILYSLFGWAYGFYLLQDQADTIFNVEDIVMPQAYLNYSMAFALVIVPTALCLLLGLWLKGYITL